MMTAATWATAAGAQTPESPAPSTQSSFLATPAFAEIVNRKSLVIRTKDGRDYEGHFKISGNTLVLADTNMITTVGFDEITRIQKSTFRMRKHALIGLGVGAGVGAASAAALAGDCYDCGGAYFLLVTAYAGIGASIGTGVGAILNRINVWNDVVYDVGTRARTLAVAPILSPSRKGVSVVMTWR